MKSPFPLALACATLLLAACGTRDRNAPRWRSLAEGQPAVSCTEAIRSWRFGGEQAVTVEERGDAIQIEAALPAAAWTRTASPDVWTAQRPLASSLRRTERVTGVLRHPERTLRRFRGAIAEAPLEALEVGMYSVTSEAVFLRLAPGEVPPEGLRFGFELLRELIEDGERRPVVGGWVGEGLAVWTGERRTIQVDVPPASALRVFTAVESLGLGEDTTPAVLTIALGDRELVRWTPAPTSGTVGAWHRVVLPPDGVEGATFAFTSVGAPARAAFFTPRIGPAACGEPGARPWGRVRPDVILFLADTFRADNLSAYGGDEETTAFLNALAARSLLFTRAWASAAWTLPSQATMFTALQPLQHGVRSPDDGIPSALITTAEFLRRHGYRTAAVTDSGYVSRAYGFDQGFELFRERRAWDLRETLREANDVLAADDGRPLFLFVQTFRTHVPYRTGPEENDRAEKKLLREFARRVTAFGGDGSLTMAEAGRRYLALYRRGARALDEVFGPWCAALEERGFFAHGYLVFTSDHGEEFVEHGRHGHGGEDWEERVRVPLFVHGLEVGAGTVEQAATLLDLPRTIAGLAGLPPPEAWGGVDLRRLEEDRPVHTYALLPDDVNRLTVLEGERKIHVTLEPEDLDASHLLRAFDLGRDPGEQENLVGKGVPWPSGIWARARRSVAAEISPVADPAAVELTEEAQRHLREIGY